MVLIQKPSELQKKKKNQKGIKKKKAKLRKLNSRAKEKKIPLEYKRWTEKGGEETNGRNVQTPFPEYLCLLLVLFIFFH